MCLAIPGKIENIEAALDETFRLANVSFGGVKRMVNLSMVPEAKVGDYVLVHVGVAISVVNEEEAQKTMDYLRKMGELDDLNPAGN
ncbi:HypC/HybG/HupF family hydrogenase formation chaperone [Sphingobacteriales bacterium UPWRP_1]|nr:HypC/HybG/HupF family hydrogenase formation chaperone [Sphingobacteriales bacterium UPWRP_1]